jgi:DNA-binding MarR family transcriptional regulator
MSQRDLSPPQRSTPDHLGHQLMGLAMRFRGDCEQALAPLGLAPREFGLLNQVVLQPGLAQAHIGQALRIDRTTMVAMVDRLAAAGWLERQPDPSDRRAYRLVATTAGRQLHRRAAALVEAAERSLLAPLDAAQEAALRAALGRLCAP